MRFQNSTASASTNYSIILSWKECKAIEVTLPCITRIIREYYFIQIACGNELVNQLASLSRLTYHYHCPYPELIQSQCD